MKWSHLRRQVCLRGYGVINAHAKQLSTHWQWASYVLFFSQIGRPKQYLTMKGWFKWISVSQVIFYVVNFTLNKPNQLKNAKSFRKTTSRKTALGSISLQESSSRWNLQAGKQLSQENSHRTIGPQTSYHQETVIYGYTATRNRALS